MSLMATSLQQPETTTTAQSHPANGSMLTALVLSVYAAQKSTKQLHRLKRKAAFMLLKLKIKQSFENLFSKKREAGGISTTTLLYILLGLVILILAFTYPLAALIILLGAIVYILLTRR